MANYANLEAFIQSKVYENANNEITGQGLQDTLLEMVKELGKSGYICQGVATTSTTPPVSSDSNIFYFAEGAGTYTNFGGLVVGVGELALFFWNGSTWDKESCNIVEIIDNLTTNDSTKALSAKQGKVLNDALQAIRQTLASIDILDNVAGSAVGLLNPIAENAEFAFQKCGSKGDGAALINSITGKTLAWNQFVKQDVVLGGNTYQWRTFDTGTTLTANDKELQILKSSGYGVAIYELPAGTLITGHAYYIAVDVKTNAPTDSISVGAYATDTIIDDGRTFVASSNWQSLASIRRCDNTSDQQYRIMDYRSSDFDTVYAKNFAFIDLTLMFGAGNEPSTVAEFESMFPLPYYEYNAGELKSNDASAIETVGFNQLNLDRRVLTNYNWGTNLPGMAARPLDEDVCFIGVSQDDYTNPNAITSYEITSQSISLSRREEMGGYGIGFPIRCFPNTQYHVKVTASNNTRIRIGFYDAEKVYINSRVEIEAYLSFTTPANCYWMVWVFSAEESPYSITYNQPIVNLSDPAKNGTYEPYWKNTLELNIKTLTGKKDGQGASVTIFPDGAGGVGSVYDELRKSVAYKRCGKRAYQAGDESDSSVITDGTNTIYVLATPETYVLDTPLKMTYKVAKGGTEERISPNADGISAPMVEEVQYPMQTKGDAGCDIVVNDGNPATINLILPIDATGAVFLTCGGATFSALVSAGQATLSISGIASGTYTFVAMYSGDEKYAPFSASDTVTIS